MRNQKRCIYRTLAKEGPLRNVGLNFLLRSSVYSNMRPCVAALESAARMHEMAGLYFHNLCKISISTADFSTCNVINHRKTNFMPRFSTKLINDRTQLVIVATPIEYGYKQRHMVKYHGRPCSGLVTVLE